MTSKIFNCSVCLYKTDKKYNFNRHMMSKHNNIDTKNNDVNNKNVVVNNQCNKCLKVLSSKQYLKKHILTCNSISNPLECHFCHKILSDRSSKSKHLKICKLKENKQTIMKQEEELKEELNQELKEELKENLNEELKEDFKKNLNQQIQIIKNQINNNCNNTNCNNTNCNNITYNINLVAYDKKEERIDYDTSHLTENFMYKITTRHPDDAFYYYCIRLFENHNNRIVLKTSMRNSFSKVHVGENNWEKLLDKYIYDKVVNNIALALLEYIKKYSNIEDKKLKKYKEYIDYMSDKGYSYIKPLYWNKIYRHNINKLKNLFHSFISYSTFSSTISN